MGREIEQNNFIPSNMCCGCLIKSSVKLRWQPFWCVLIPGTIYLYPLNKKFRKSNSKKQLTLRKKIVVNNDTMIKVKFFFNI